jgi:hypothetical protein
LAFEKLGETTTAGFVEHRVEDQVALFAVMRGAVASAQYCLMVAHEEPTGPVAVSRLLIYRTNMRSLELS